MPREKSIVEAIRRLLKARGAWDVKYHGSRAGRAGVPDVLACHLGVFLAIEVKQPGGKTTRLQELELASIEMAGGFAIVASSKQDVERVLDHIERNCTPPPPLSSTR